MKLYRGKDKSHDHDPDELLSHKPEHFLPENWEWLDEDEQPSQDAYQHLPKKWEDFSHVGIPTDWEAEDEGESSTVKEFEEHLSHPKI